MGIISSWIGKVKHYLLPKASGYLSIRLSHSAGGMNGVTAQAAQAM